MHATKQKERKVNEQEGWSSEFKGQRRKFHKEKEENFEEGHGYQRRKKWRMDNFSTMTSDEGLLFMNFGHVFPGVSMLIRYSILVMDFRQTVEVEAKLPCSGEEWQKEQSIGVGLQNLTKGTMALKILKKMGMIGWREEDG